MNAMCIYFQNVSQGLNLSLCVIQMQSTDCNIRLQSDCGDCSLIVEIAVGLWRLQVDCVDCSSISGKCFEIIACIRLLGLLWFDCFRITCRLHQIALDYLDCPWIVRIASIAEASYFGF